MEKAAGVSAARLAVAAAALCLLLLAAGPREVSGAEGGTASPYDKLIHCKVLGNCDKNLGPEATRPGKPANKYTRGCSKIDKCRG